MDVDSSMMMSANTEVAPIDGTAGFSTFSLPVYVAAASTPPPPLFGMIAAGAPMRTDFVPADQSGTKFTMSLASPGDLPSPLTLVHQLAFCILPGATLPPNTALMIYWQLQTSSGESSGFELLGTLIPATRPSDFFRTGWAEHDQFLTLMPHQPAQINIGISLEPLESVQNVAYDKQRHINNNTTIMAQKIGQDLFNYMKSFDTNGAVGNQTIAVPANTFDRWWQRFETKLQRDPNFFLKTQE
jgi:hypothetical protein